MVVIVGSHIYCANVGDSRTVLSKAGGAINLSLDHKASRPDEVARIENNNGLVQYGRVGKLAITRAFGDFSYKIVYGEEGEPPMRRNLITSEPEIRRYDFDPDNGDEFIVIASDGLYDKFTSQQVVDYVRQELKKQSETMYSFDLVAN